MSLYATDKEYKERFDYFLEEVKNDEGNKLDETTRYLAVLSVLMGNQGICAYEEVLEKALRCSITCTSKRNGLSSN